MRNIQRIFPLLAPIRINTSPSNLFIEGESITSCESVTQGDPLAMAFYALATIPLIEELKQNVLQIWYADDAAGAGKICSLRSWWDKIRDLGPAFGYFPNATKSQLLVIPRLISEARDIFKDTRLSIISEGKEYLGGAVGSHQFMKEFVHSRVQVIRV